MLRKIASSLFCLAATAAHCEDYTFNRHDIYLGGTAYHIERSRSGGASQKGWEGGAVLKYDRIKYWSLYWGGTLFYAQGNIKGHAGDDTSLKSRLEDIWGEGRFGYTFQCVENWKFAFSPYVGGGAFQEKNHYRDIFPLHLQFRTSYPFVSVGFLASGWWTDCLNIGLEFNARYPIDPRCRITHDYLDDDIKLSVGEKWQYRLNLPITYAWNPCGSWAVRFEPFWEFRHFGERMNFDFVFLRTKYQIYGFTLGVVYRI